MQMEPLSITPDPNYSSTQVMNWTLTLKEIDTNPTTLNFNKSDDKCYASE